MTTGKSGQQRPGTSANNWPARRWFLFYGVVLVICTALYLFGHSKYGIRGYEHARFTSADIRHINSILVAPATPATQQQATHPSQRISNSNDGFLDTYNTDTTGAEPYIAVIPETNIISNFSEEAEKKERVRKAMVYIRSQYSEAIDAAQLADMEQYISTFSPRETGIFLADYRLKLRSFFWLSGIMLYAEVISWVIFGVLCSLLLFIGKTTARSHDLSQRAIIYQSARLLYAPFAAVIPVLIYNYLKGGATLHISASELIIVFAFVLGFYSGTVMEILDRLRGNNAGMENGSMAEDEPEPGEAPQAPAQAPYYEDPPVAPYPAYVHDNGPAAPLPEPEVIAPKPVGKRRVMNEDNEITEVDIDLKLDFSGLFDEERAQLQRLGFSKAIVTLHNVNGKDIIPAKKVNDDMTTFVANDVKPGIYIARATLSQRLRDDQIINLFGEKTAYITEDKPGLELFVKKYEAAG